MTIAGEPYSLERRAPESQGISSSSLHTFIEKVNEQISEMHSVMLLRHACVVAEGWWSPYGPQSPHMLFSLSKSFTSTAAGLVVSEGRLSLDDPVLSFFPDQAPADPSDNLRAMRVRHLLSMSTGHAEDTLGALSRQSEGNWVRAFLEKPVEFAPGTHFLYNSGATYMISAIVHKMTGEKVLDYLRPRLLDPLGIVGAAWESCPRGINVGGWGLSIKTEDIARFAQLYLQRGVWRDRRILPEGWVKEATAKQISNGDDPASDWNQGYGFQFWRCRHDAFRGDGAFGQFCVVIPDQDAVLAITGGIGDLQGVLNLVWDDLLPAMGSEPLPANHEDYKALRRRLAGLVLRTPEGQPTSPAAAIVSGRTYLFEPNERGFISASFDFRKCEMVMRNNRGDQPVTSSEDGAFTLAERASMPGRGDHRLVFGMDGAWVRGTTCLDTPDPRPVAASAAWVAGDTFVIRLCFYETPFCPTITCRFEENKLLLDYQLNVSFGPLDRPQLVGWAED